MYIYELNYMVRKNLCALLDHDSSYEELGVAQMKFDPYTVMALKGEFYRGASPSNKLLELWGAQNHTVLELFVLLARMKNYQAMTLLKPFVDQQYHDLIKVVRPNINQMVANLRLEDSEKILNGPPQPLPESKENNESHLVAQAAPPMPRSPLPGQISDLSSVASSAGTVPQIPYDDLMRSTNNWDQAKVLGRGGFGVVFRGDWKCTQVAIKRIERKGNSPESFNEQYRQSITELHCLNSCRHDNILPLYGYSLGGEHPCLVYQYMSGGNLEHRLHVKHPADALPWATRLNIAIGTARGLQFLHSSETPLVHGDIKSANILLDPNDNPRIGDFGLARGAPQSEYMKLSRVHGTKPYLPAEFLRGGKFSTKVDTYSFGVVLFEIGTALAAQTKNEFLRDFILDYKGDLLELKDKRLQGGEDYYKGLIEIGKLCVDTIVRKRPEMVNVLIDLENIKKTL